jgi:hypothetical protein
MRIKFRRYTWAEFQTDNPILADGEPAFETDTGQTKIGDGVTPWIYLPYTPWDGPGTIAYAENRTGTVTSFSSTSPVFVTGCFIIIPPTKRDVWVEWGVNLGISTAGGGEVYSAVYETTSGVAVAIDSLMTKFESTVTTSNTAGGHNRRTKVGPSDVVRHWALYGLLVRYGGSGLVANFRNINSSAGKSYLSAVAQ